jgi:hypothetical protein
MSPNCVDDSPSCIPYVGDEIEIAKINENAIGIRVPEDDSNCRIQGRNIPTYNNFGADIKNITLSAIKRKKYPALGKVKFWF